MYFLKRRGDAIYRGKPILLNGSHDKTSRKRGNAVVEASLFYAVKVMIRLRRKRRCPSRGEPIVLSGSRDKTSKEETMT